MSGLQKTYNVLGIMSGTSFDGLDLAFCTFYLDNSEWTFQIRIAETISYSKKWVDTLKSAETADSNHKAISESFGSYIGKAVNSFMKKHAILDLDLISSHGHTLFHDPAKKISFQAGEGQSIFNETKVTVVSNFRQQDIQLGGQGAPLVPIGDLFLFKNQPVCINLGGFANISIKIGTEIKAWDICPVNYVLNHLTRSIGFDYDDKGKIAASNKVNSSLLRQLNALSYYDKQPPKSLSREWVYAKVWPIIDSVNYSSSIKIATITEHAAIQIAKAIPSNTNALFTGGGTFNDHLISRIKHHCNAVQIDIPNRKIIEYKEALIFGFLGVLRIRGEINILSAVTGASKNHSSGDIIAR